MNNLLIPFGLHRATRQIIEPEDAARGRACNCICPGCQAPLLSRHPKQNRIHFAHDSKHPDAKPEQECPFSSAVAIAMMAREIAEQLVGTILQLPQFDGSHYFECCGEIVDFSVTTQKQLQITSAGKNPDFKGLSFDLEVGFGNARVFIDLYYKGKPLQSLLNKDEFLDEKLGVLAIDCNSFDSGILTADKKLRFSDAVRDFILSTGDRAWTFHPRQPAMVASIFSSHRCKPQTEGWNETDGLGEPLDSLCDDFQSSAASRNSVESPPVEPKSYRCTMCQTEWLQKMAGVPVCSQCKTHLFTVEV